MASFLSLLRLSRIIIQVPNRLCSSTEHVFDALSQPSASSLNKTDGGDSNVPIQKKLYVEADEKCILCRFNVKLDYKNTRLLQQFVSSFSGRVYEQHITGLCDKQYRTLLRTIKYSRKAGYMPVVTKDPKYLRDPKLFDPMRPTRPHSYA